MATLARFSRISTNIMLALLHNDVMYEFDVLIMIFNGRLQQKKIHLIGNKKRVLLVLLHNHMIYAFDVLIMIFNGRLQK